MDNFKTLETFENIDRSKVKSHQVGKKLQKLLRAVISQQGTT